MPSDSLSTPDFNARLTAIELELASQRENRHALNSHISTVIDEERKERLEMERDLVSLQKAVSEITNSVKEVVDALKGGQFGQAGLVAQIAAVNAQVAQNHAETLRLIGEIKKEHNDYRDEIDAKINEGRGMARLLLWASLALGAFATWKQIFN